MNRFISRFSRSVATAVALFGLAGAFTPVLAQTPASKAAFQKVSNGGRLVVNAMEYPWSAIGRLNVAGRAFCSGFLIGNSTVLTAAHCMEAKAEQRWRSPTELHFVAGYQRDTSLIDSPVHHYVLADDYEMSKKADPLKAGADWAVVRLGKPIGGQAGYLGLERVDQSSLEDLLANGAVFLQAGYRGDWPHVITADLDCDILGFIQGTMSMAHDCDAVEGDSGSPVLAFSDGEFRAVGLISMRVQFKRKQAGKTGRITGVALASAAMNDRKRRPNAFDALARTGQIWDDSAAPAINSPASPIPSLTIQTMLQQFGIERADPTGRDQAAMSAAIRTYQRQRGLPVTGKGSVELLGYMIANSKS